MADIADKIKGLSGIAGKIKEVYLSLEDRYYAVLDKVDAKVHIYGVIDRVDRVVPSFLILIAVAVLIVAGASLMLLGGITAPATLAVTVLDEQGSPVEGATVVGTFFGGTAQFNTDVNGKVKINIPLGAVVDLTITKSEFEDKTSRVTVSKAEQEESITLRSLVPLPTEKTLQFVDGAGRKLAGTRVSVSFSCSKPGVALPEPVIVNTGELKITPPKGCGVFTVNATASGYKSASYSVEQSMQIGLDALVSGQGSLKITVNDADTGAAVNGIKVVLQNNLGVVDTRYTDFGEVTFLGIVPAEYYATVEDERGDYGSETITGIAVAQGTVTRREAQISRSVKANLSVAAKDKASKAAIADAEITLQTEDGIAVSTMKTGSTGVANFAVRDAAQYYVRGFHEAYLVSELIAVDLSTAAGNVQKSITVEMEKLTAENSGRVEVKVLDEDSLPVENAIVSLFDAQTEFLAGYKPQATDANGIAKFMGVKAGTYYALAQKYPASGKSGSGTVDVKALNEFAVNIVIGNATVEISAVDLDGEAVPFAIAELRAENEDELGSISLDEQGFGSKKVKADKRVFVAVSKDDYARYTSAAVQLFKDQTTTITAILEEEILGNKPVVLFKGLYKDGAEAQKLEADGTYTAKLQLRIPTAASYTQAGVHFRTGTAELVDKDKIFINGINAPNASYMLGKTYNPPSGWATDNANLTNSDAKWANVWWDSNVAPGVYNIEFELKVRAETVQGTALPVNYRAWAVDASSAYLRDPEDAELGTAADGAGKQELYSQAYTRNYFEGADEQCDAQFCFAERLFDPAEGLYLSGPPYTVKIFQDHDFTFSITNNSPTIHDNATLRVRNTKTDGTTDSTVRIRSYSITNADAQAFTRTTETFDTGAIASGYFIQNKTISGDMVLQAAKLQNSDIELRIISGGIEVFNQSVEFNPVREEDLAPEVKPDVLAAYTGIDLNVHVTYKGGTLAGFDADDALVRVTRISPDKSETVQTAKTNENGVAQFAIPASSPGTKVRIQVEKAGFASSEVEKIVTCGVIEFTTEDGKAIGGENPIASALNLVSPLEQEVPLKAKSLVPQAVKIVGLSVVDAAPGGVFQGLLDLDTMNNFLTAYVGSEFTVLGQTRDLKVKAKLSNYAKTELNEKKTLTGFVKVGLGGSAFTQTCEFSLPLDIDVSLVPAPENESCLTITNWDWKEPIGGGAEQWQFTITNNCMAKGSDTPNIDVSNLKAQLSWASNKYGTVSLTLTGASGAMSGELTDGFPKPFSGIVIKAGEEYSGLLEFTPFGQYLSSKPSEPAKFNVAIEGEVYHGEGSKVKGDKEINAELQFVDPAACIDIVAEGSDTSAAGSGIPTVRINADETEKQLSISTQRCGVKMDLGLCMDDYGKCAGGVEGSIRLSTRDLGYRISGVLPDRPESVTVGRGDIPGYYDVELKARIEGSASWQFVGYVPVIVETDGKKNISSTNYFSLPVNYKFTLLSGESDKFALKNNYFVERLRVYEDWPCYKHKTHWWYQDIINMRDYYVDKATGIRVNYAVPVLNLALSPGTTGTISTEADPSMIIDQTQRVAGMPLNPKSASSGEAGVLGAEKHQPYPRGVLDIAQDIAIKFKNNGINQSAPVYGLLTIGAKENLQGDSTHLNNSRMSCPWAPGCPGRMCPENCSLPSLKEREKLGWKRHDLGWDDRLGHCRYGESEVTGLIAGNHPPKTITSKLHVRFDTAPFEQPLFLAPEPDCTIGTLTGQTGPDALPKVKYNWNWSNLDWNSCDASNPDAVYCDSTQFMIMLNKRLYMLYDFLAENSFEFQCPPVAPGGATRSVASGKIGLSQIQVAVNSSAATATVTVTNRANSDQNGTVTITIRNDGEDESTVKECKSDILNLRAGSTTTAICDASGLSEGSNYLTDATLACESGRTYSTCSSTAIDSGEVEAFFVVQGEGATCEYPLSTDSTSGKAALLQSVESDPNTVWTADVPNAAALQDLLLFEAYLMRDGYGGNFAADFVKYYDMVNFLDTPAYFNRLDTDASGQSYGFDRLLEQGDLGIIRKLYTSDYPEGRKLSLPGLYKINIAGTWTDNWEFFKTDGTPNTNINVILELIDDPAPPSPFYFMPLDGFVGVENYSTNRQGYGVSFSNEGDAVKFNDLLSTMPDSGSNAILAVSSKYDQDFANINSKAESRGVLLDMEYTDAGAGLLTFAPHYATPLLMKVSRPQVSGDKFGVFYSATQGNVPVDTGEHLAKWTGMGNCLDFSGMVGEEAFNDAYDRRATQQDLTNWMSTYGVDWAAIVNPGNVYLRTIFYTPAQTNNALKGMQPLDSMQFITPDSAPGTTVALNGIGSMAFNNSNGAVGSVEDVFQLVQDGKACISRTSSTAKFWWNPKAVYEAQGAGSQLNSYSGDCEGKQRSVWCEMAALQAGTNCIGS